MLTDQELQGLRNCGNDAEAAADEIAELREAYALLFRREGEARAQNDTLRRLLAEASSTTRHPDYDWPVCLQREVDEALGPNVLGISGGGRDESTELATDDAGRQGWPLVCARR